jgi:phenylacetate-CoA ligase
MNKHLAWLYKQSPVLLQNLMISAFGYKWKKRRFGGIFETELKAAKGREYHSWEQWRDYQTTELRKLLVHAFDHVPFYREKYSFAGLTRQELEKLEPETLHKLPPLEKNELRQFGKTTLLSKNLEPKGEFYPSSGSTGTPVSLYFSERMHQKWSALFEARVRHWAGVSRFDARGMIGGRRIVPESSLKGPFYRYNFFEKQVYFSAYHITPLTAPAYAEAFKKHPMDYMTGYAMANYILAMFFLQQGIGVPKLKAVITSSEKLTPEMRHTFAQVYGCKTYDSYSGAEACGLISENEHGQLLISPDVGIMEILKADGAPCQPGDTGEVYSTGFLNYNQPLIRYRIGDLVKLSENQNAICGRKMAVVDEIIGRTEDVVIGKDGREMVRFHGIFIDIPKIIESQVIQRELARFEIEVVVSEPLTSDERKLIQKRMESQLGEIKLEINEVEKLPRNANGKIKAVISHVKK